MLNVSRCSFVTDPACINTENYLTLLPVMWKIPWRFFHISKYKTRWLIKIYTYRIHLVCNRTIIQHYRNLNITRRLSIKTFNNYYYRILKSKQILIIKRNSISKYFFQTNLDFKKIFININSNGTVSWSIHTNRNSLIHSLMDSLNRFVIFVNEFDKSLPGYLYILELFPFVMGSS